MTQHQILSNTFAHIEKMRKNASCAIFLLLVVRASAISFVSTIYYRVDGYLCVRGQLTETVTTEQSIGGCAGLCSLKQRCQAFTTADGPCQLFVFDRCSKSVRDCSCSRRGQVFVKQQPGLQPGALCPSGYGDELCGVKYKMYNGSGFWWPSRQKCESESGLVIMADVTDADEMIQVDKLYTKYSSGSSIWLGGYQPAGSAEPSGGWYWVGCNITVATGLWTIGEPNNEGGAENAIGRWNGGAGLTDMPDSTALPLVLCECASPF